MSAAFKQAQIHIDRGELDLAATNLIDHLNGNFLDDHAIFQLSACYHQKKQHGVAAALLLAAIDLVRKKGEKLNARYLINLGAAYKMTLKFKEAVEIWNEALPLADNDIDRAQILCNIGGGLLNLGDFEAALDYFEHSAAVRPDDPEIKYNRGYAELALGQWEQGWADYELGFKTGSRRERAYPGLKQWDGSPGKTVIVYGEQGIGDEILFASMIPDLIRDCKRVIFDCHPRLVELMRRSFPELTIYGTRKQQQNITWLDDEEADGYISISQLGRLYRKNAQDFPGTPFLKAKADPNLIVGQSRPRIGISWVGGSKETNGHLRSIALDKWMPILRAVDADFYSLQYTPDAARQVCELEEKTGLVVKHWPGWVECKDYDKTATFVASMDLVITVCTSIYHLAGAIGKPVWVLTPSRPAWRYTPPNEAWYRNTAQFYRQQGDDWAAVIQAVAKDLANVSARAAA